MKRVLAIFLILLLLLPAAAAEEPEWIEIRDIEGLKAIADKPDGSYRLVSDIDLDGIEWKPISFEGTLDGNGHAILNMTVKEPGDEVFKTKDGNKKNYETVGAGLFACSHGCTIRNLKLLGVYIDIKTDKNCFCGMLIGGAVNVNVTNCDLEGRIFLDQTGKNSGVGGAFGFVNNGSFSDSYVYSDLVIVDSNRKESLEEFAGGVLACGHMDITDNKVRTDIYSSVHGYCHNGGLIGMFARGFTKTAASDITGNQIKCRITFFEDTYSRRAYGAYDVGEELNGGMNRKNNKRVYFKRRETKNYKNDLYPCTCVSEPNDEVIESTETEYGYTKHTCPECGYTYNDHYTLRKNGTV